MGYKDGNRTNMAEDQMKKPKQTLKAINKQGNNGANLLYTNTFVVIVKNNRNK